MLILEEDDEIKTRSHQFKYWLQKEKLEEISNAYSAEDRINKLRNSLRDEEIESIESDRKNYQTSVYYMDIVSQLETMGDFLINISQTLYKTKSRIS